MITVGDLVHMRGSTKGADAIYLVIAGPFAGIVQLSYCGSSRWFVPFKARVENLDKAISESKNTKRALRWLKSAGHDADGWKRIAVGRYGSEQRVTVTHIELERQP